MSDSDRTNSDDERAWNESHGLTAACKNCGGAMRADGREFCSHACYYRSHREAK